MLGHDEMLRGGYAYVGVYTQITGVSASPLALKFWDPIRYAPLHHPGDEYEFDIFSQAARAMATRTGPSPGGSASEAHHRRRGIAVGGASAHVRQPCEERTPGTERQREQYGKSELVRDE